MTATNVDRIARDLDEAERAVCATNRPGDARTLADAYLVQRVWRALKQHRGARLVGWKAGTTSENKLRELGIDEPLFGFLIATGAIADGGRVDVEHLIAPRIEMEFAFVTATVLDDPACDAATVLTATAFVAPAFEIIDSRYGGGAFDVHAAVADNVSTARHVIGDARIDPRVTDLATVHATMWRNGTQVGKGSGVDVLGHPARSVACLVRKLARDGERISPGSIILSGGIAPAVAATAGDAFRASFEPGGAVSCTL